MPLFCFLTFAGLSNTKKILVIRFSSIGDIVLTSPVVRCLRQQTGAQVHFLTKKSFAGILQHNPYIDKIITIEKDVAERKAELLNENYDFIADLHHNLRSLQVKRLLKKPSASFPKLNIQKWMLVNLKINRMPEVHIVDRYFETVKNLGVVNDHKGLDYFISAEDEVNEHFFPETHRNGFIAVTVGAKFGTKQMPVSKLVQIIRRMNKPVVLLGGNEDRERANEIGEACGILVFDLCGKCSLGRSAAVMKQADAVIAHDTGLMHIAAAMKKKIYSVWGNTVPELGMYPYLPGEGSQIIEVKNLSCRPCSKIGYQKCPKSHFRCMNDIDIAAFDNLSR
ncbi:MAG: glycosyltransferase family 9 protein [Bacteroidia bacterium]